MKSLGLYMIFLLLAPGSLPAQEHVLRYHPEGGDFVIVNGTHRFNRALYGTHTAARVEAGDLPEFALYMPGMGGNLSFAIVRGGRSHLLVRSSSIKASYRPGSMLYDIRDPLLGSGVLHLAVLALADAEGLVIRITSDRVDPQALLIATFGGASGKKFSRDGDIGADPESSFDPDTAACRDDQYTISGNSFQLTYNHDKRLEGVFPATIANQGNFLQSMFTVANPQYLLIRHPTGAALPAGLSAVFDSAEVTRRQLADRVVLLTPDPYLNTMGGALAVAADGIWEAPSYLHGGVAWRQRLPGWRGPYVADPLGWHDRARQHFSSYAQSQLTTPDSGPVVADTALHLARQLEKVGTSLFSSGYICRSPGGDMRPHHYDMNLVFIDQLLTHFYWTGDTAYVRQMWPVLQRHLAWEKRNFDADGDGLYDAYCCIWASDALEYSGGGVTHSSAYNYRANLLAADLARLIGEDPAPYAAEADHILHAINTRLWMPDKGWYAEYVDRPPNAILHPAAGLWTIYHAIDSKVPNPFQAWESLHYIDAGIPHIPIHAAGLEDTTLYLLSTTNWQPYMWSLNNVVLAESLHTALAYWQGNRPEEAFRIWKSALVESMYLGSSPGNFEQLSAYDAARGELFRDFADPIGMAARSLVEGLFGIDPDALHDTLTITPGWPMAWAEASLHVPDITIDYSRVGVTDQYHIIPRFSHRMTLRLRLRVHSTDIRRVRVNGQAVQFRHVDDAVGGPVIELLVARADEYHVVVSWGTAAVAGEVVGTYKPGSTVIFEHRRQGNFSWWEPKVMAGDGMPSGQVREMMPSGQVGEMVPSGQVGRSERIGSTGDSGGTGDSGSAGGPADTISLSRYYNDDVTRIFKNQYLSPRPATPTLQLPTQGIGNWCYPLVTANIDDAGLRHAGGELFLPNRIPLATPASGSNVIFASHWSNYPDSVTVPLRGRAAHAWFLLAGSTNPMQSRITNGMLTIHYTDGSADTLLLINPSNWWPIEEDYLDNGLAFTTGAPHPIRVSLKTGIISDRPGHWTPIKGLTNTAIDGGAATVLDMPLHADKLLDHLTLTAIANDVVIGLMSVTLIKTTE
jgi:hypothetical protein